MKSNKLLRGEFNELVANFAIDGIVELAKKNQARLPYIQNDVLFDACLSYVDHKDDRSIRALVNAGFQMFAGPDVYGMTTDRIGPDNNSTTGLEIIHYEWTSQEQPTTELAGLLAFIYEQQYEQACESFFDDAFASVWEHHDLGLAELKALHASSQPYQDWIRALEADQSSVIDELRSCYPHVKFAIS